MMLPIKFKLALGAAALAYAVVAAGQSFAAPMKPDDGYPSRPITLMMCFGKGGGSGQANLAISGPAAKIMGVKINIVSKPGGGGLNCLPDYWQTPADGYTILQHVDAIVAKYVEGASDINPATDLESLLIMNVAPTGLYIRGGDERFMTNGKPDWDKVVKYAKIKEGNLKVSNINIAMELISMDKVEKHFGFKSKQILFPKPAQRYGAVIGGKLDVLMEQPGDVSKHVQAGTLAPVLTIWPERFKIAPDTKATGADYGLKWDPLLRWRGLFVKKGTPKKYVKYLREVFAEAYRTEEHQAFIKRKNLDIVESFRSAKDMQKMMENAVPGYAKTLKANGWKVRPGL